MTDTLPEGRLIRVTFEVRLPAAATPDEIEEWVEFSALHSGGISDANPLCSHDVESFNRSVELTNTGMQGRREEYGHRKEGGTTHFKVRYIREPAP